MTNAYIYQVSMWTKAVHCGQGDMCHAQTVGAMGRILGGWLQVPINGHMRSE